VDVLDYPKTVLEMRERFPDEQACRDYLVSLRWPEAFGAPPVRARIIGRRRVFFSTAEHAAIKLR
jgi:hypothetical protein